MRQRRVHWSVIRVGPRQMWWEHRLPAAHGLTHSCTIAPPRINSVPPRLGELGDRRRLHPVRGWLQHLRARVDGLHWCVQPKSVSRAWADLDALRSCAQLITIPTRVSFFHVVLSVRRRLLQCVGRLVHGYVTGHFATFRLEKMALTQSLTPVHVATHLGARSMLGRNVQQLAFVNDMHALHGRQHDRDDGRHRCVAMRVPARLVRPGRGHLRPYVPPIFITVP